MKKLILLMLIVSLVAIPVLSCATNDDGAAQNGGQPEAPRDLPPGDAADTIDYEPEIEEGLRFPDLPDVNFGGYQFRIINTGEDFFPQLLKTLVVEEETGEALNDAIFRRNRRMEERFGFQLIQFDVTGPTPARDRARTSIQAGSDDFDLVMTGPSYALPLAQGGMLEMIDRMPHIDLTQPWWDGDMVRDYSFGGRVFFATGDFTFNHYSVTFALLFNKELHYDLGLDCPYELVREGRWTIDRFAEQGRAALRDLNGDGVYDHNDQWGIVTTSLVHAIAKMNGVGARYVVKDADDMPVLNMNTQGFIDRFHALYDLLTEGWVYCFNRPNTPTTVHDMFLNGQALFYSELMNHATRFRAMDADFGIIPQPKLNEQQEHHISAVGIPHIKGIPVTSPDLERTGIILEALSAESRLSTLEVYFDTMLVNQVMNRDEESAEMLEIIFANRVYEVGRHFWSPNMVTPVQHAFRDFNRDIVSVIERHEAAANAAIETTVNAFLLD